jgi:hypothetical protein
MSPRLEPLVETSNPQNIIAARRVNRSRRDRAAAPGAKNHCATINYDE